MQKEAHISARKDKELGDRLIGLCGTEFKYKVAWADIPADHPICRACVDEAIKVLTEEDATHEKIRIESFLLNREIDRLSKILLEETRLDKIFEADDDLKRAQAEKREAKALKKKTKQTCTCTWTAPEIREDDPNCPIHGGELDAVGVDVPEITEGDE